MNWQYSAIIFGQKALSKVKGDATAIVAVAHLIRTDLRTFSVALSPAYEFASLCRAVIQQLALYSSKITNALSTQI
jgi:hypothetical protein